MPTGLAQEHRPVEIPEQELDEIRACLHRISSDERPELWSALDLVRTATIQRQPGHFDRIIADTPAGRVRDLVATHAARRMHDLLMEEPRAGGGSSKPSYTGVVPPRRYHSVSGIVGSVGQWSSRAYWWFSNQDLDVTGAQTGEPLPLLWNHRRNGIIGLSRNVWLDEVGDLHARFDVAGYPTAQQAASLADQGVLGFSLGSVCREARWLTETEPDQWDPASGAIDCMVRVGCLVDEVSLTPSPQMTNTVVEKVR